MSDALLGPGARFAKRWGWAIITGAVLLVYWPLSSFTYTLGGGDAFDCWLPWRWFISLSLSNGELPLWDPLQQMGYPIYADLQGPAWYPEAIALGGTVGHTIYTLQALYLGYIIIGGIGLMRLVRSVHSDARVALIAGTGYALSGFFTGHQMHFYSVISGAWMPWLIAAQVRLMRQPHWRSALEAAVLQFLLLTGGNHTFTIIGAYLFAAFGVVSLVCAWRVGDRAYIGRLLKHELLFAGASALMACGTLFAWWEVRPFLDRAAGMGHALASEQPFTIRAALSLLFPYANGAPGRDLGTDPSMANGYMGLILFVFAMAAFLRKRTWTENVLGVFGIICGLAAFGDALPVHGFLWKWLPGMDLFRFPSYFLWFTMMAMLVLAAGSLKADAQWRLPRQRVMPALFALTALLVMSVWWSGSHADHPSASVAGRSLFESLRAADLVDRLRLCAVITFVVLVACALIVRRTGWSLITLFLLIVIEMGWQTQLAQWNTAVSDISPAAMHLRMMQQPDGPIDPDMRPMGTHTDGGDELHYLWRNTQDFRGQPTHDGFNTFWLKHANDLEVGHSELWKAMKRQPLFYLTDHVISGGSPAEADSSLALLPSGVQVPQGLHRSPADRIEVTMRSYGSFLLHTTTSQHTFLMVQQAWYPGWSVSIDDRPVDLVRANYGAFGTFLPAGEHDVSVAFKKPIVPVLYAISFITFLLILFVLSLTGIGPGRKGGILAVSALAAAIGWSLFAHGSQVKDPGLIKLIGTASGDHVHYHGSVSPKALSGADPYTQAFRLLSDSLTQVGDKVLVLEVTFHPGKQMKASFVVERKSGGKSVDYEAVPLEATGADSSGWYQARVLRDLREFRYAGEEVGFYVWDQLPDTLLLKDVKVFTTPRTVAKSEQK